MSLAMLPILRLFASAVQPQSAGIAAESERDRAAGAKRVWSNSQGVLKTTRAATEVQGC